MLKKFNISLEKFIPLFSCVEYKTKNYTFILKPLPLTKEKFGEGFGYIALKGKSLYPQFCTSINDQTIHNYCFTGSIIIMERLL